MRNKLSKGREYNTKKESKNLVAIPSKLLRKWL